MGGSLSAVWLRPYTGECINGHKHGVGAVSVNNFQYHLKLVDKPPQRGIWRHVSDVPQWHDIISVASEEGFAREPHAFNPPRRTSTAAVS